jgi:hypothetical protein
MAIYEIIQYGFYNDLLFHVNFENTKFNLLLVLVTQKSLF